MTLSDTMKHWQAAALRAKSAVAALRARWEAEGRTPRPGDLIDPGLTDGVHLLALERHPRHPSIVRVVVADEALDAGASDVVLAAPLHPDPMVVRTALTRWVPAAALRAPHEACDARVVNAVLAAEAAGAEGGADARAVDDDPAHQAHLRALRRSLQALPVAIVAAPGAAERRPLAAAPAHGASAWGLDQPAAAPGGLKLAAQSIAAQMLHALEPSPEEPVEHLVPWEAPGELTAVATPEGAELLFCPAQGATAPPAVWVVGEGGAEVALAWQPAPDASVFASVPRQPWRDGVVRFRVGADPALDVTVAR